MFLIYNKNRSGGETNVNISNVDRIESNGTTIFFVRDFTNGDYILLGSIDFNFGYRNIDAIRLVWDEILARIDDATYKNQGVISITEFQSSLADRLILKNEIKG